MSMLFNMFSKQVQTYCKTKNGQQNVSECKRNMMTYGVEKLNDMGDASLDKMDPYQRNADNIRKFRFFYIHHKKFSSSSSVKA
jgi:hypothetical protein